MGNEGGGEPRDSQEDETLRSRLPSTLSIIRDTLPFHAEFMDQRKTPLHLYFIRRVVDFAMLVFETSASIGPKREPPLGLQSPHLVFKSL